VYLLVLFFKVSSLVIVGVTFVPKTFVVCISASKLFCFCFFLAQSFLFLGWNLISLKHILRHCS
jgi:hypothetical protein